MTASQQTISIQSNWVQPATILFAAASPADERAFACALAEAHEHHARLILFHVFDVLATATEDSVGLRPVHHEAARLHTAATLEPLRARASALGVDCEIVVQIGIAAAQILAFVRQHSIDRIVMASRVPGRLGKFFLGSVAEEVLRSASVPVITVGPNALDPKVHGQKLRRILCTVSHLNCDLQPVLLAAKVAQLHNAQLTVLHLIPPREESPLDPGCSTVTLEAELQALLPNSVHREILVRSLSAQGSVAGEILFQAQQRQSDLIVLGAHPASTLATLARQGMVNQVLAESLCPVMTLKHSIPKESLPISEITQQNIDFLSESSWLAGIF